MGIIDEVLTNNQKYAQDFKLGHLPMPPAKKLAIVACMDARLTVEQFLGLHTGEAHIIRNAGGVITEDAIRSLIISYSLLGTRAFMIINHTDCGMLTFKDDELFEKLQEETGTAVVAPSHFHAFRNPEQNVHLQIQKLKAHPWIPKDIPVKGFVYDVKSGRLKEVNGD